MKPSGLYLYVVYVYCFITWNVFLKDEGVEY